MLGVILAAHTKLVSYYSLHFRYIEMCMNFSMKDTWDLMKKYILLPCFYAGLSFCPRGQAGRHPPRQADTPHPHPHPPQTPPPPAQAPPGTATAADGTHPTGMDFYFILFWTVNDLIFLSVVMQVNLPKR